MQRKKWQFLVILAVGVLTVFNILPTLIYYAKPLDRSIKSGAALSIAKDVTARVQQLEQETRDYLESLAKIAHVKPLDITEASNGALRVHFADSNAAWTFAGALFKAKGSHPFAPARLTFGGVEEEKGAFVVSAERQFKRPRHEGDLHRYFGFAEAKGKDGEWTQGMRHLVFDRMTHLIRSLGSSSETATALQIASQNEEVQPVCLDIAHKIVHFSETYGLSTGPTKRYFSSFANGMNAGASKLLKEAFGKQQRLISKRQERLKRKKPEGHEARLKALEDKRTLFAKALATVSRCSSAFDAKHPPFSKSEILEELERQKANKVRYFNLGDRDPFIAAIALDSDRGQFEFMLHADLEERALPREIMAHLSTVAETAGESVQFSQGRYIARLHDLKGAASFLTLDLSEMMRERTDQVVDLLRARFKGRDAAFKGAEVLSYEAFKKLKEPRLFKGFVVLAPALYDDELPLNMERSSLYVIARSMGASARDPSEELKGDFQALRGLLYTGASGYDYPSSYLPLPDLFHGDYFFEVKRPLEGWLKATRERWRLLGSQRVALLELSNHADRIDEINRIETEEHKELLRWRDDYRAASVDLNPEAKLAVPPPTKSPLWNNFKLSFRKYFRGDRARVLKWGLDLSGGKTVHVQLLDRAGHTVTDPDDLAVATSELYLRANRLGISDVAVRSEGGYIVMDFPGSQNLSARDLVSGSSMAFHIVNEAFAVQNPESGVAVNQFLGQVWNEALMRGDTSLENITKIAHTLLMQTKNQTGSPAALLWAKDLRLSAPNYFPSADFDESLSRIVRMRGDDPSEWLGQNHPLMIVFANFALEGSSLADVYAGYDPEKGNYLSFKVLGERLVHGLGKIDPQQKLGTWTGRFAKGEKTGRRGWRMAAILNDEVISAPALEASIQDSGMITGSFTMREIKKLESDLRAGSLSFTPKILSESNISPELGLSERTRAVIAMSLSLLAVMAIMMAVYRLGGFIASCCVIFNLFIMWAIFQSLGAALSLATIAGIILTIGMAVDANVLVFERIREEYAKSSNLKYALAAGYRRAFSAIFDSNLTTVVAALILLNFDSGPIKGFALTIVVGIVSSMFTALFVSRYCFSVWADNPRHTSLSMARIFKGARFNFFRGARIYAFVFASIIALGFATAASQGKHLLGMDFTGGYALRLELKSGGDNLKARVQESFGTFGLTSQDVRLRTLENLHTLKVMLAPGLQGKVPALGANKSPAEKVAWILSALKSRGLQVSPEAAQRAEQSWVEMSSELSDAMTTQALFGLGLALLAILLYISWRFEATGAIAAIVCLIHDVGVTLSMISLMRYFGLDLQIDLHTIAALMTIVGYSLNDTIIIFDRVREQRALKQKGSLREQINRALSATLSRTMMTSLTTLVVLLFLVGSGGGVIFGFACVMTAGVVFGTLSSLLLAGPLWAWLAGVSDARRAKRAA